MPTQINLIKCEEALVFAKGTRCIAVSKSDVARAIIVRISGGANAEKEIIVEIAFRPEAKTITPAIQVLAVPTCKDLPPEPVGPEGVVPSRIS